MASQPAPAPRELAAKPSHNDWSRTTPTLTVSMMPWILVAVSSVVSSMTRLTTASFALKRFFGSSSSSSLQNRLHARHFEFVHLSALVDELSMVGDRLLDNAHPLVVEHCLSV